MIYLYGIISALVAAAGAWVMSRYAVRFGMMDVPNDRSSHELPTPRGGGVGILLAFVAASLSSGMSPFLWVPTSFISIISFFDDRLHLSPGTRLIFQFSAAGVALFSLLYTAPVDFLLKVLLLAFFLVFIVGTANFYNFMDGINGIAGLTGFVGFLLLTLHAHGTGNNSHALLLLAASCSCLGFLPFNIPSARVFMGDVGSVLLGFFFALSVVMLASSSTEFLALAGCLFTFYADTLATLYVRWRNGEKLSQAHRRHLYQLLVNQMGVPHWKVSLGYASLQAVIGFACLKLSTFGAMQLYLFLCTTFTVWCLLMAYVRRRTECTR